MLNDIKSLLGIAVDDTDRDDLIKLLISLATQRLKVLIKGIDPPEELEYIIVDVVISRFNRIGSEGMSLHTVEGETLSFTDDDFKQYEKDIESYLNSQKGTKTGRVRFI